MPPNPNTPTTVVASTDATVVGVVPGDRWLLTGSHENKMWATPVVAWLIKTDGSGTPLIVEAGRLTPAHGKGTLKHPEQL